MGFWYLFFHSIHLLILCDDVERNRRLKNTKYFSLCRWNLNSVFAHEFEKVSAVKAFNVTEKFDFLCLPKSYLDFTVSSDENSLSLNVYKLICSDHPMTLSRVEFAFITKKHSR